MKRQLLLLRCLLAIPGIALLLTSALFLGSSMFGTPRFTVGQALCVAGVFLPAWLMARVDARRSRQSAVTSPSPGPGAIRPAQFHMGTQTLRLAYGLALAGVLGYCAIGGAVQLRNLLLLRKHGVTLNATITGTTYREGKPQLTVSYSFPVPHSLPVYDTFQAPRRLIGQMQTGVQLPVTYLPADPNVHSWQPVDNALIVRRVLSSLMVFLALMAYIGLPIAVLENRLRRQLRLARTGAGVTGTIAACRPFVWRGRRRGYLLTYTFALPSGHVWSSQAFLPHVEGEPTLPGFPITILYDAAQPSTNLPLASFHAIRMKSIRKAVLAM
jgi:hypothetical protein